MNIQKPSKERTYDEMAVDVFALQDRIGDGKGLTIEESKVLLPQLQELHAEVDAYVRDIREQIEGGEYEANEASRLYRAQLNARDSLSKSYKSKDLDRYRREANMIEKNLGILKQRESELHAAENALNTSINTLIERMNAHASAEATIHGMLEEQRSLFAANVIGRGNKLQRQRIQESLARPVKTEEEKFADRVAIERARREKSPNGGELQDMLGALKSFPENIAQMRRELTDLSNTLGSAKYFGGSRLSQSTEGRNAATGTLLTLNSLIERLKIETALMSPQDAAKYAEVLKVAAEMKTLITTAESQMDDGDDLDALDRVRDNVVYSAQMNKLESAVKNLNLAA